MATPYAKKLAKQFKVCILHADPQVYTHTGTHHPDMPAVLHVGQVDLATIAGSGPAGRIVASDVEAAAGRAPAPPAAVAAVALAAPAPAAAKAAPAASGSVPFTGMQTAVTKNMEASLAVPVFHVGYTITTDAFDNLYKQVGTCYWSWCV